MSMAHCSIESNGMSNDKNNNKISVPLYIYYRPKKSFIDQYLHHITSNYTNKQTWTCSINEK